ncbi:Hypothetical predicted protein [Podarcis lilfordi]|uniref:Uncharacterized protein n=1 Tax=Podarcis lilfordi TaxID=74358 RepID=A0AA35LMC5_9SAUR|nr:Hypothetical predicted protein [Podarcis lilfordi]
MASATASLAAVKGEPSGEMTKATAILVDVEDEPSGEMAYDKHSAVSCADEKHGATSIVQAQGGESGQGGVDNGTSSNLGDERTGHSFTIPQLDCGGNEMSPRHNEKAASGSPASDNLIVLNSYTVSYRWSPMLKYCKPKELGHGPILLC